jgi:hypothetical protein
VNFNPAPPPFSLDATLQLKGSAIARATLDVASAAGFGSAGVLFGDVLLSGNALIEFSKGQITTIAADADVALAGPDAFIADASDTSSISALIGLQDRVGYARPRGLGDGDEGRRLDRRQQRRSTSSGRPV